MIQKEKLIDKARRCDDGGIMAGCKSVTLEPSSEDLECMKEVL